MQMFIIKNDASGFAGETLSKAGSYLGASLLVGLLKSSTSNGLNLVSAPAAAKAAGIKVKTQSAQAEV